MSSSVFSRLFEDNDPQTILDISNLECEKVSRIIVQIKVIQTHFENVSEIFRMKEIEKTSMLKSEESLFNQIFGKLEENRSILTDIDKYFAVTKKLINIENSKKESERKFVISTDTFFEENNVFIGEMINREKLRREMEAELKAKIEENRRLTEELNYIKGSKIYKCLLEKKVSGVFDEKN